MTVVLLVNTAVMRVTEVITAKKPLSPEQARVRALQAQVDQARLHLTAERERQRKAKALKRLQKL